MPTFATPFTIYIGGDRLIKKRIKKETLHNEALYESEAFLNFPLIEGKQEISTMKVIDV